MGVEGEGRGEWKWRERAGWYGSGGRGQGSVGVEGEGRVGWEWGGRGQKADGWKAEELINEPCNIV